MKSFVTSTIMVLASVAMSAAEAPACDGPAAAPAQPVYQSAKQNRRYLAIKNETGQKLTVWLRYNTWTDHGRWLWFPVDPQAAAEGFAFELEPASETYLQNDDFVINANRVRIWAETEAGDVFRDYKDTDLWLVPEEHSNGDHCYYADEMETFTFTFSS